jgi:hypothetical protein
MDGEDILRSRDLEPGMLILIPEPSRRGTSLVPHHLPRRYHHYYLIISIISSIGPVSIRYSIKQLRSTRSPEAEHRRATRDRMAVVRFLYLTLTTGLIKDKDR